MKWFSPSTPPRTKQGEPEEQMEIGPEYCTRYGCAGVQQMMVIVPVNANIKEAQDVAEKRRQQGLSSLRPSPCGIFMSRTMIVITIAITPSLKASSLVVVIYPPVLLCVVTMQSPRARFPLLQPRGKILSGPTAGSYILCFSDRTALENVTKRCIRKKKIRRHCHKLRLCLVFRASAAMEYPSYTDSTRHFLHREGLLLFRLGVNIHPSDQSGCLSGEPAGTSAVGHRVGTRDTA